MKIVENKMYDVCGNCGSIVCVNKAFFGGLHICLSELEKEKLETSQYARDYMRNKIEATRKTLY